MHQLRAVCVPRGLLSTGAIRRAIDLLRFDLT